MAEEAAEIAGAHVEWFAMIRPVPPDKARFESHEEFYDRDAYELLDDTPNRVLIAGWNYGPRSIQVAAENVANPNDILPGSQFTIPGVPNRIMIRVV